MGKKKFFKCPKCSSLLQVEIELPENVESWPYVMHYKHMGPNNTICDLVLAVDSNYTIRELGKNGLDETKEIVSEKATEEKTAEELGFKVVKE
ncbi:MAG: hypothetical protein ACFFDN_21330 [Candidatus Hodarchaeota archaeon]